MLAHSRRWGWKLSVPKTAVVVFANGDAAARALPAGATFHWREAQLTQAVSEKCLGSVMHVSCTWDEKISHAATKGRGALYVWLRALRGPWLTAAEKAAVLHTRIAPRMYTWFGTELWRAAGKDTAIGTVMMHAARAIAGTCASPAALAYVRLEVLLSDLGVLPTRDMCHLAHARHRGRTHRADACARSDRTGDALSDC